MHEKMSLWLELLLNIRASKQIICVRGPREHHDLRDARTHLKNFEIWRLSKSLGVFPEGYRFTSPETFEGLDGTLPDFKEEFSAREIGGVIGEWLKEHKDSRIIILHDGDTYWREVCGIANAESTSSMTIKELAVAFNLDTGEKQDQTEEWPRRLRDFLDGLDEPQTLKLVDFLGEFGCQKEQDVIGQLEKAGKEWVAARSLATREARRCEEKLGIAHCETKKLVEHLDEAESASAALRKDVKAGELYF